MRGAGDPEIAEQDHELRAHRISGFIVTGSYAGLDHRGRGSVTAGRFALPTPVEGVRRLACVFGPFFQKSATVSVIAAAVGGAHRRDRRGAERERGQQSSPRCRWGASVGSMMSAIGR